MPLIGEGPKTATWSRKTIAMKNTSHSGRDAVVRSVLAYPTTGTGCILETTAGFDDETFGTRSIRIQDWAEEFGCKYDGWDCQLMNQ
jgi:hypothetical protein